MLLWTFLGLLRKVTLYIKFRNMRFSRKDQVSAWTLQQAEPSASRKIHETMGSAQIEVNLSRKHLRKVPMPGRYLSPQHWLAPLASLLLNCWPIVFKRDHSFPQLQCEFHEDRTGHQRGVNTSVTVGESSVETASSPLPGCARPPETDSMRGA